MQKTSCGGHSLGTASFTLRVLTLMNGPLCLRSAIRHSCRGSEEKPGPGQPRAVRGYENSTRPDEGTCTGTEHAYRWFSPTVCMSWILSGQGAITQRIKCQRSAPETYLQHNLRIRQSPGASSNRSMHSRKTGSSSMSKTSPDL